jgi:hypothetical protein
MADTTGEPFTGEIPAKLAPPREGMHPDDEFHYPTSDTTDWSETCWFTFTVPERKLSGQLYPFFRANLNTMAAGAYFWDPSGNRMENCVYSKNFWHLPIPQQPLSDITIGNGIHYKCLKPQQQYEVSYHDPDGGDEIHVELVFDAVREPHYLGQSHIDQPGRYTGEIVIRGDKMKVDSFGFRDRSWGPRTQHGPGLTGGVVPHGGYSYATASADNAFHTITMDWGEGMKNIHGYLVQNGEWAKLATAERVVEERNADGFPTRVRITGEDEKGRKLEATGIGHNGLSFFINPNMYTMNCLFEWTFNGITAWGEDHDNWSHPAIRKFNRERAGA